jgi:predicted nuclease of predicted toxin-antitoxin system
MKFLVDENLPNAVPDELVAKNFDVSRPISGSMDTEIAELAKKERRVLLTLDME